MASGRGTKNAVLMTMGNKKEKMSVQPGTKGYKKGKSKKGMMKGKKMC